jgi:hypothetical protein
MHKTKKEKNDKQFSVRDVVWDIIHNFSAALS